MSIRSNVDPRIFDQRVTFQRKIEAPQDANSGALPPNDWTHVATCWACINATKSNERYLAEQIEAQNDYTVIIRWRDDIDANMRIVWKGQNWDIRNIPDQQRRGRLLYLTVQEGINNG